MGTYFSCDHRRRLLDEDHPKRILLGVLKDQLDAMKAKCVGFVVMPDHVHALVWLPETGQLSRFMHGWKRMSSFRIRSWYRDHQSHYFEGFGEGDRFWQPKYYSFPIYSRQKLEEKMEYIHLNPVRAGLVEKAVDWRWSSARWYEQHRTVGVPIDWIECRGRDDS
jgi:putative transposase